MYHLPWIRLHQRYLSTLLCRDKSKIWNLGMEGNMERAAWRRCLGLVRTLRMLEHYDLWVLLSPLICSKFPIAFDEFYIRALNKAPTVKSPYGQACLSSPDWGSQMETWKWKASESPMLKHWEGEVVFAFFSLAQLTNGFFCDSGFGRTLESNSLTWLLFSGPQINAISDVKNFLDDLLVREITLELLNQRFLKNWAQRQQRWFLHLSSK